MCVPLKIVDRWLSQLDAANPLNLFKTHRCRRQPKVSPLMRGRENRKGFARLSSSQAHERIITFRRAHRAFPQPARGDRAVGHACASPAILRDITTPRCAGTHTVAGQDEVKNPQAKGRLILLVIDLGCLCGGADLAELTRVSPEIHGSYHQSV